MIAPAEKPRTNRLDLLAAIVMLPAVLGHELTHALVAWWWVDADRPAEIIDRVVPPRLELTYPSGTPVVVVVAANLAPTIVGLALAPALVPWAFGLPVPLLVYVLGAWALYTRPSRDDLAVLGALV